MKICFLLQRNYALVGHALACWLKEKYGVNEFCAYTGLRRIHEFLKSQTALHYHTLLLDEDVHARYKDEKLDLGYLQWLERELGIPNLWPYLALDREIMFNQAEREYPYNTPKYSHEEMLRILQVTAKAVISFLDSEKPNALVFSAVGNVPGLLLYTLAKKRDIKVLCILTAPLRDKVVLSESYDAFSGVEELYKRNLARGQKSSRYVEARKMIEDFRKSPHPYDPKRSVTEQPVSRGKQLRFLLPRDLLRSFSWFVRLVSEYGLGTTRRDYTTVSPWNYLKDHLKRKARNLIGVGDLYDNFDQNEDYAYFALHYEPEITLLLLAPFATNQIEIARQAALALPIGWKLYIKDHPEMVHYRPRSYYIELKKIPNVRLINPTIDGLTVTANAKLIFTVTGSAAWEGLLLKKPAIVFGNQFYNGLSMIKVCKDREQLPFLVKRQLEQFQYNEEELLQFTAAILEDTTTLPFIYLWEQETNADRKKQGLEPLADLLASKLNLHATNAL